MKTLYLCGAINGCTDSGAMDWRERVKRELADQYEFLDPMRRDYRGRESEPGFDARIVLGDTEDIARSDAILVAADEPSWGTAMEVRLAWASLKYVLVVCAAERPSPWLTYHANFLVPTLPDAILHLRGL